MPIKQKIVEIFDATGGLNEDSIPCYSDDKAPNGGWVVDMFGKQLTLQNGLQLIIVDREQLIEGIDPIKRFYNDNGYTRVWLFNANTGSGDDIVPGECWVKASRLRPVSVDDANNPGEEIPPVLPDYAEVGKALEVIFKFIKNTFKE